MEPMIEVHSLSKKYQLGEKQSYYTFRDWLSRPLKDKLQKKNPGEFWALENVSFDVAKGNVVGIIGRNGAGKSTLLKILSQITPPTSGEVIMSGRVASLLEVGTGFHAELTGRENVYLNGAILGMKRSEINKQFNNIIEFAEISKFLDTPVKHYSSGMYMRLAFAVAAHLEPEILLVDEVLAVGDVAFQKKCLGKMGEISKTSGRTILFVSHNMGAIQQLCQKTVFLERGRVVMYDKTEKVIASYLKDAKTLSTLPLAKRTDRSGNGKVVMKNISLGKVKGQGVWHSGDDVNVELTLVNTTEDEQIEIEIALEFQKNDGTPLIYLGTKIKRQKITLGKMGESTWRCEIPKLPLEPGDYNLIAEVMVSGEISDLVFNAVKLEVAFGDFYGTGLLWPRSGVLCEYNWKTK